MVKIKICVNITIDEGKRFEGKIGCAFKLKIPKFVNLQNRNSFNYGKITKKNFNSR